MERFWDRVQKTSVDDVRESCVFVTASHGVMGFALGGFVGLFMASIGTSAPELEIHGTAAQVRAVARDLVKRSYSSATNFAKIAAIYSAAECAIESYRAKHDIVNTVAAGCVTGGLLSAKAGPKAALLGCAGFAAFSTAVDHFLQDRY